MKKTAVITGATSGFGLASARVFAAAGWNLILIGRRKERLQSLSDELSSLCHLLTITLDLNETDAVIKAMNELKQPFHSGSAL